MNGLKFIPGVAEFSVAYARLQDATTVISNAELALWSQWTRFDPRLAEQIVQNIACHWRAISPLELNTALRDQPWPAAAAVLIEQAGCFSVAPNKHAEFRRWKNCVLWDVAPASDEQFFIGLRAFAGDAMRDDACLALRPYRVWGYLGRDVLVNKAPLGGKTLVSATTRRQTLNKLIQRQPRLRVRDYISALGGWVSARQAELDLAAHPRLRAMGRTKARYYLVVTAKRSKIK